MGFASLYPSYANRSAAPRIQAAGNRPLIATPLRRNVQADDLRTGNQRGKNPDRSKKQFRLGMDRVRNDFFGSA